ncbi:hypothetical protein [Nocardia wallacei]|uniref:hypothetical protein n=1 Tax=Nocardia wallacei TaxID=480035 RepID=UPI002456FB30|nr:hypothetical protein [Nocardia wallacei]
MKVLRAVSGVVAGGLVMLTLVLFGAAFMGDRRGFPGPGTEMLAWHIGLALMAVAAQIFADRSRGLGGVLRWVVFFYSALTVV